jgi:hypothetical protein
MKESLYKNIIFTVTFINEIENDKNFKTDNNEAIVTTQTKIQIIKIKDLIGSSETDLLEQEIDVISNEEDLKDENQFQEGNINLKFRQHPLYLC